MFSKINSCYLFLLLGILLDVFVLPFHSDLVILVLSCWWLLILSKNKLEGSTSIFGGLTFLGTCAFFLIFQERRIADKLATWAFLFLTIGLAQILLEYRKKDG